MHWYLSIYFRPAPLHFSPSLLHIKAEIEDGSAINGEVSSSERNVPGPVSNGDLRKDFPVRFGFDESTFPGFSWRGYAIISDLQVSAALSNMLELCAF